MKNRSVSKAPDALQTIGEVSADTGVAMHILRYWERNVPELQPLRRGGGRRLFRAGDVELVRQLQRLVGEQGYTLEGAARSLRLAAGAKGAEATDANAAGRTNDTDLMHIRLRLSRALQAG